ncbi:MAG: tRNA uracil 4-sulfurtransferase ThiI [Candidatus Hydrothermarchaeaceae archaeon]
MIIVRYGEIGTKSRRSRARIEGKLVKNIKLVVDADVRREYGRIFVDSSAHKDAEMIARVFGVVSTSLAVLVPSSMKEIIDTGKRYALTRIKKGESFAVRARRTGKHDYKSADVASKLGDVIRRGAQARVDLEKPDHTIYVEVRDGDAYIFDEVIQGVGGLPLGSQGTALALISGGIDSPVAAWMMMKRGLDVSALFMDPQPLVDKRTIDRARNTIKKLASWRGGPIKTYIAPYGDSLIQLLKAKDHSLGCVLCKRMIYRVGEEVANIEGAKALITGENLGQVASQTADNLAAITAVTNMPVFRPLIGLDKMEIIELAKKIGTYEVSIAPANCCLGPPRHPATSSSVKRLEKAESALPIKDMVKEMLAGLVVEELM